MSSQAKPKPGRESQPLSQDDMENFRRIMDSAEAEGEGKWTRVEGGQRRGCPKSMRKQQELWKKVRKLLEMQVQKDRQEVKDLLEKCNRLKYGGAA